MSDPKLTRELVLRTQEAAELLCELNELFDLRLEEGWSPQELDEQAATWEKLLDEEDNLLLSVQRVVAEYFDTPLTASLVLALVKEFEIKPISDD